METLLHSVRPAARRNRWALLIFLMGIALRLCWLGEVPGGLNQDEASIGYDAWALLHYGIDRNGFSWPVHLVSWGSGQNALYAYLSFPFIALGGLTVVSVRMLAAVSGLLVLGLFWLLGRREDRIMAFCALLLIATSPWHIMASRWALEANILPVVVLLSVFLFVRADERRGGRLPLAAGVLGLSVYAYGPAYMFAPLFLICALVLVWRRRRYSFGILVGSLAVAGVVALPIMGFLLNNAFGTDTIHIGGVSLPRYSGPARYSGVFLPFSEDGWRLALANAGVVIRLVFCGADDDFPANAIPGWGPQFVFLTPFILFGMAYSSRRTSLLVDRLMLAWLLCALLTAVMTEANINRVNLVWLPSLWMAARGLWLLGERRFMLRLVTLLTVGSCCLFSYELFAQWRQSMDGDFFAGLNDAVMEIVATAPASATIAVTDRANMPYITALFASRTPPDRFLATAQISDRYAAFQQVTGFDRFRFGLQPEAMPQQSYWVAERSELGMFDSDEFVIRTFGNYASVVRRAVKSVECQPPIKAKYFTGVQDYGALTADGEVGNSGNGFDIAGVHFTRGLGVHGDSAWTYRSTEPLKALSFGVGVSDDSSCSDGVRFTVSADGRRVFDSGVVGVGGLQFHSLLLDNAHEITLQSHAGASNRCDHGNWIRPRVDRCTP